MNDPLCKHKFIHFDTDKFKKQAGRNTVEYTLIDRFFCEKCAEIKEISKTHVGVIGEKHGVPDWALTIEKYVDMGYRY